MANNKGAEPIKQQTESGLPAHTDVQFPPAKVVSLGDKIAENELDAAQSQGAFANRLAMMIARDHPIALGPGGGLYFYRDGRYHPADDNWVRNRIFDYLPTGSSSSFRYSIRVRKEVTDLLFRGIPELWEKPPSGQMAVRNGIVHLRDNTLQPARPQWLSTVQLPIYYNPEAECPKWDQFLLDVFPSDCIALAWEIMGSCLTADHMVQQAIWLKGPGGNGKSTLMLAIQGAIGDENCANMSIQDMNQDRFATSSLLGKLLLLDHDTPLEKIEDASIFKKIVSHDEIRSQEKWGKAFLFRPHAKVIMAANDTPKSTDTTLGFLRRLVIVPFDGFSMQTSVVRRQEEILGELRDARELSGWLNKAIAGWQRVQQTGKYSIPGTVTEAIQSFRDRVDPFRAFFDRTFELGGPNDLVLKDDFTAAYAAWCEENGIEEPMSTSMMTRWVQKHCPTVGARHRAPAREDGARPWAYARLRFRSTFA
jgi:P4 family phage/plasmid primase-like protien